MIDITKKSLFVSEKGLKCNKILTNVYCSKSVEIYIFSFTFHYLKHDSEIVLCCCFCHVMYRFIKMYPDVNLRDKICLRKRIIYLSKTHFQN